MAVTEEDVVWCYQSILRRDPESKEVVRSLISAAKDFRSLVKLFLDSEEHRTMNSRHALVPLSSGKMDVEITASSAESAQLIGRIREAWTHLGKVRPHHSVLTGDDYLPEAVNDKVIERFYESGMRELATIEAILDRHGFSGLASKTCVDYGCGLGRVTLALASKFATVHGYDISANHLALAEQRAAKTGVNNVRFHLCSADVIGKPLVPCDFFFSFIVFQHNPPPIMLAMLAASLQSLREGGIAIFQLPTYGVGYSFRVRDYLAASAKSEIEMHCLPQEAVLSLIAREHCTLLEVREDDRVAGHGAWISNTFVVKRAAVVTAARAASSVPPVGAARVAPAAAAAPSARGVTPVSAPPKWRRVLDDAIEWIGVKTSVLRYPK